MRLAPPASPRALLHGAVLLACLWPAAACDPPPGCPGGATCLDGAALVPTGTMPNDVRAGRCGDDDVALVPASFDARVDALSPAGAVGSVFMGSGTNPWAVAGEADALWVTLWNTGEVALLDVCRSRERGRLEVSELVEVSPPALVRTPLDADGDGAEEQTIASMRPRTPQAIVARDNTAWVAFTNLLEASAAAEEPPVFGPGVVARLTAGAEGPLLEQLVVVPCVNPQGLALARDTLWVSCSGPLGPDADGRHGARADGALLALDTDTLAVRHRVEAGRFAPATPAADDDWLVVGSLVTPRVAVLSTGAASFDEARIVELPGAEVDSVFEVVLHDGVVTAPVFSRDRLYEFDVASPPARVDDAHSVLIGPGGDPARGLLALDMPTGAHGPGLALLTLSAEVVWRASMNLGGGE